MVASVGDWVVLQTDSLSVPGSKIYLVGIVFPPNHQFGSSDGCVLDWTRLPMAATPYTIEAAKALMSKVGMDFDMIVLDRKGNVHQPHTTRD